MHRPWFVRGDIEATVGSMLSCLVTLMIIISVCYVRRVDLSGNTICDVCSPQFAMCVRRCAAMIAVL